MHGLWATIMLLSFAIYTCDRPCMSMDTELTCQALSHSCDSHFFTSCSLYYTIYVTDTLTRSTQRFPTTKFTRRTQLSLSKYIYLATPTDPYRFYRVSPTSSSRLCITVERDCRKVCSLPALFSIHDDPLFPLPPRPDTQQSVDVPYCQQPTITKYRFIGNGNYKREEELVSTKTFALRRVYLRPLLSRLFLHLFSDCLALLLPSLVEPSESGVSSCV